MTTAITPAAPCVEPTCRTTGGYVQRRSARPLRARGLCVRCYSRHDRQGTLTNFPKLGWRCWASYQGDNAWRPAAWHTDPATFRPTIGRWRTGRAAPNREAAQLAAYVRAHPDLFTVEGQRTLFVGPVVERGTSYWLAEDTAAGEAA